MKKLLIGLSPQGYKLFGAIILGLMLISMASASDYLPHKQNTAFDLIVTSNNATQCNWTYIQYPNGSKVSDVFTMTKTGQDFSQTILLGNFSLLGSTCMGITCYDGSQYEGGSVCREVTPQGFINTLGFYFLLLIISAGLIILGFSIKDNWVVVLGGFALILVGLYTLFYGIDIIKDPVYTWGLGIIILMVGAYFGIRGSLEAIVD